MSFQGVNVAGTVDTNLTVINNITNNNFTITGSGVGNAFIAATGIISGFQTLIFNHNLTSDNIQPQLFIRHALHSNNWEPVTYQYNDTRFETGYADYGFYDFKTGANPFNGWSGFNHGNCSMLGFSGGSLRIVASAANVDFLVSSNTITGPAVVKRVAGDFDVWADLTGVYTTNFHGNGLLLLSLNQTGGGSLGASFAAIGNIFNTSSNKMFLKTRDIDGENSVPTIRDGARYYRFSRRGGQINAYYKSGINDDWNPVLPSPSGRSILNNVVRDEVLIGMFIQTTNTSSSGLEYKANFIKSWSPIELRASGTNNIAIINNVSMGYEYKIVIPTSGFDLTTGIAGPRGAYYFVFPSTVDTASNNLLPDLLSNENNVAYEFGATLKVPCSGQPIIGNILKNGSNLFAFTVPTGITKTTSGINFPISSGDVLTATLSQVGTTSPGTTLTLSINVR